MSLSHLSIIIPVHNEEKNIGFLYSEVLEVMKNDFS
jgi:glycosyltransferase involved in cell wall biosynthesis